MSCISAHDPQLARLADAIAQRVGQQRFNVWFNNSTRLELKQDGLEIAVPNDFISEWIGTHYTRPIQDAVEYGVKISGVTVHFVDEGVDSGPVILQESLEVPYSRGIDAIETFHDVEHRLLPRAIRLIAKGNVRIDPAHPRRVLVEGDGEG